MFILISQSPLWHLQIAFLSNQQPETQIFLIYFDKWHREAANPHILEAKPAILLTVLIWKMTEMINWLSK